MQQYLANYSYPYSCDIVYLCITGNEWRARAKFGIVAEYKNASIIHYMGEQQRENMNWALYGACRNGHKALIRYFKLVDWRYGVAGANIGGYPRLADICSKKIMRPCIRY